MQQPPSYQDVIQNQNQMRPIMQAPQMMQPKLLPNNRFVLLINILYSLFDKCVHLATLNRRSIRPLLSIT